MKLRRQQARSALAASFALAPGLDADHQGVAVEGGVADGQLGGQAGAERDGESWRDVSVNETQGDPPQVPESNAFS